MQTGDCSLKEFDVERRSETNPESEHFLCGPQTCVLPKSASIPQNLFILTEEQESSHLTIFYQTLA